MATNNNAQNVSTGKPKITGAIYRAPLGTALPTDAVMELNEAFNCVGYISEDGVSNDGSIETDELKAWGGDTVLIYQTGKTDDFKFEMLETLNVEVQKAYFGDNNVTGDLTNGIVTKINANERGSNAWVIDMNLRNAVRRIVIPDAKVKETGEIVYQDVDAIKYPITLGAQAYAGYDGDTHREFTKSAA